jgi:hypothetical protein
VDATLRFSEVPVNTTLADADTDYVEGDSLARLYRAPVIPAISAAMREVVVLGKSLGNRAGVVTKIGDSLSANPNYLTLISRGDHDLGPYDYLEDTVNFFGPSLAEGSVASRGGLTTYVVFDPLWADDDLCNANESPLDCELRRKQPSIATILFGQNDVRHMTDGEFEVQMRQLVEETLAWGVIPVLTTFSANPDEELYWQSINFNLALMDIAAEYEVPLINLWSAARPLPNYGLDIDSVHLTNSGFASLKYSTGHESWYGVSLLNLLTLRTLDEIRRTLEME